MDIKVAKVLTFGEPCKKQNPKENLKGWIILSHLYLF
jgi:hypothetical protein